MIITICDGRSSSDTPEWAMIEMNGELVFPKTNDGNDILDENQVELGSLRFSSDGSPIMIVGSHELKGIIVTLKQPFAVMNKKRQEDNVEYHVVGVVTKKLLFDKYPKSIMR